MTSSETERGCPPLETVTMTEIPRLTDSVLFDPDRVVIEYRPMPDTWEALAVVAAGLVAHLEPHADVRATDIAVVAGFPRDHVIFGVAVIREVEG